MSAEPSSQTSSQTPRPQVPPQTFDILPALHELLARIEHHSTSGPNQLPDGDGDGDNDVGAGYTELQPLEPKDLPTEVLAIKARIRKALKELEKLPDMGRGVQEQQEEIKELEERIVAQKEAIRALGEVARKMEDRLA